MYHDIAHHIDAKNHEILSAKILRKDENLKRFFNAEQIKIMSEAVEDHRSSMVGDPRSIYGKIAGFIMMNNCTKFIKKGTYIAEFYIMPKYRRRLF